MMIFYGMQNRIQFVCRRFIFYCGCYLSYVVIVEHAIVYSTAGTGTGSFGEQTAAAGKTKTSSTQNKTKGKP